MKLDLNFHSFVVITTFFINLFSESQQATTNTKNIIKTTGKNCSIENEYSFCGDNAFCDLASGRCTCNLGFRMTPNPNQELQCTPYQCRNTGECRQQFNRSVCWPSGPNGTCTCETSYWWDPLEGCRTLRSAPGTSCYANVDCGLHAYCDQEEEDPGQDQDKGNSYLGSICRCVPGSELRDPGNVNCRPIKCDALGNQTCPARSVCDANSGGRCLPDGSFELGDIACGSDEDCRVNRKGSKKKWRCHLLSSPQGATGKPTGFCLVSGSADFLGLSKIIASFVVAAISVFLYR